MKTPEKNQKKQGSSNAPGPGSKSSTDKSKQAGNKDKGAWKNPDPTHPNKSPEKVNEPYAKTASTFPGNKQTQTAPGTKKEKITNAGESEHHIPVNKSDSDKFEDEYEDFELDTDEEEEDEEEEDEDGETNSQYDYEEEEDEDRQFRSQVPLNQKKAPLNQKKVNEQNKAHQPVNKAFENKKKSQLPANSATGKNKKNPQA